MPGIQMSSRKEPKMSTPKSDPAKSKSYAVLIMFYPLTQFSASNQGTSVASLRWPRVSSELLVNPPPYGRMCIFALWFINCLPAAKHFATFLGSKDEQISLASLPLSGQD